MNLKEFLVIRNHEDDMEVWTRAEYDKYIHETLFVGACPAVAIVTHFNEDERLLTNEELKEGGGMRWVKASERVPEAQGRAYYLRFITSGSFHAKAVGYFYKDRGGQTLVKFHSGTNGDCDPSEIEWLDEYAAQFAGTREEQYKKALEEVKYLVDRHSGWDPGEFLGELSSIITIALKPI